MIVYTFKSGLPAVVTCRMVDWFGEPCRQCYLGAVPTDRDDDTCPTCSGTGHTDGHGPAIVSAAPIEKVRFSDVHPETTNRQPGCRDHWYWPAVQSHPLWPLMESKLLPCGLDSWRGTEEECVADASRAVIAWARQKAGLPKWTPLGKEAARD
mgnify:CR=1 FL=1